MPRQARTDCDIPQPGKGPRPCHLIRPPFTRCPPTTAWCSSNRWSPHRTSPWRVHLLRRSERRHGLRAPQRPLRLRARASHHRQALCDRLGNHISDDRCRASDDGGVHVPVHHVRRPVGRIDPGHRHRHAQPRRHGRRQRRLVRLPDDRHARRADRRRLHHRGRCRGHRRRSALHDRRRQPGQTDPPCSNSTHDLRGSTRRCQTSITISVFTPVIMPQGTDTG